MDASRVSLDDFDWEDTPALAPVPQRQSCIVLRTSRSSVSSVSSELSSTAFGDNLLELGSSSTPRAAVQNESQDTTDEGERYETAVEERTVAVAVEGEAGEAGAPAAIVDVTDPSFQLASLANNRIPLRQFNEQEQAFAERKREATAAKREKEKEEKRVRLERRKLRKEVLRRADTSWTDHVDRVKSTTRQSRQSARQAIKRKLEAEHLSASAAKAARLEPEPVDAGPAEGAGDVAPDPQLVPGQPGEPDQAVSPARAPQVPELPAGPP